MADYFERCVDLSAAEPKLIANWITTRFAALLNRDKLGVEDAPITPEGLSKLLDNIAEQKISANNAKAVLEKMWVEKRSAGDVINELGLEQIGDDAQLDDIVDEILRDNPQQVQQYLSGKERVFAYFIGQAMKASKGKANPSRLSELFKKRLSHRTAD